MQHLNTDLQFLQEIYPSVFAYRIRAVLQEPALLAEWACSPFFSLTNKTGKLSILHKTTVS